MLIHKTSNQKVCNIEKHYELVIIEYNSMKITQIATQKNVFSMTKEEEKSLTKKDVSKENSSIVTKDDASIEKEEYDAKDDVSIEKKENTMQKENVSILKKSHTDLVFVAMSVASDEEILMNHQELYVTVSDSNRLKSVSNNLK